MVNINLLISGVVAISVFFIFVAFVFLPVGLQPFQALTTQIANESTIPNVSSNGLQIVLLGVFGVLGIVALMLVMLKGLGIIKLGN